MRLFTAINFDDKFKIKIAKLINELQKYSEKGNFTRTENLHLTLQFIGETEKVILAKQSIEAVDFRSFPISFKSISGFKRQGSQICWLGVAEDRELKELAASVGRELSKRGFKLEDRPFVAHLTLGREVVFKNGFDPEKITLPPGLNAAVEKISLMKSERIRGMLTYSEIAGKKASAI